jgi:hypothetical protein
MTRTIGGPLDWRRLHWFTLTPSEQAAAIRRLAAQGASDHGIAHATGLAVEQVRRILGGQTEARA